MEQRGDGSGNYGNLFPRVIRLEDDVSHLRNTRDIGCILIGLAFIYLVVDSIGKGEINANSAFNSLLMAGVLLVGGPQAAHALFNGSNQGNQFKPS